MQIFGGRSIGLSPNFIILKIKCLKCADVLQPDSDYHGEEGPVTHLFLKLTQHSKCKN